MRYIRKNNDIMEEYSGPGMGDAWYAANGWTPCAGTLPPSRLDLADGAIIELPAPDPEPRVLSKLKICEKLEELGLWETAKPLIEAEAGEYWTLAHDISEAHPKFAALLAQLRPQLEAAEIDLDSLLDECILERY